MIIHTLQIRKHDSRGADGFPEIAEPLISE